MAYAGNALRRMLGEHELELATMDPSSGIQAMLSFYAEYQPQHGETDQLWCSWGGRDEAFDFTIARRMTRHDYPEVAVALTFVFRLTPARARLSGERVISSLRDATSSDAFRAIARDDVVDVRLDG